MSTAAKSQLLMFVSYCHCTTINGTITGYALELVSLFCPFGSFDSCLCLSQDGGTARYKSLFAAYDYEH